MPSVIFYFFLFVWVSLTHIHTPCRLDLCPWNRRLQTFQLSSCWLGTFSQTKRHSVKRDRVLLPQTFPALNVCHRGFSFFPLSSKGVAGRCPEKNKRGFTSCSGAALMSTKWTRVGGVPRHCPSFHSWLLGSPPAPWCMSGDLLFESVLSGPRSWIRTLGWNC